MAKKTKPCLCPAYSFPHRPYGGKCPGSVDNWNQENCPDCMSGYCEDHSYIWDPGPEHFVEFLPHLNQRIGELS